MSVSATQPLADWLAKIGLEQYAPVFADNDIDVSVLRHLTDVDLEKIGVSLGHRRKMLAAIAELAGAAPASQQPALTEPKRKDTAERRQVTVMFSDLVGSTDFRREWTRRTCGTSFQLIRSASRRRCSASAVRSEVHGRRRSDLLRLSPSPRRRR